MQPFVKQTINKKSVFKTWRVALLAATLGFGSYTTAAAKTDNSTTAKVIENYFGEHLAGKDAKLNYNAKVKATDIASSRTMVWEAWKRANDAQDKNIMVNLPNLSDAKTGKWQLPANLEPNAIMPYYYGKKVAAGETVPADGLPLFVYMHGSGPKAQEWTTGLKLAQMFEDSPSAYFIPQIPNEGNYYRWWQKSKQWAWEKLLCMAMLSGEINPNRIYMFGISEGGYGSQRLASYYADYLAAAGPMAGGEPLRNAPVENCANIGFSFLTGEYDQMFFRNHFTTDTKMAFDSLQALHPDLFKHRIELVPNCAHQIDYRPTTPWLSKFTRNPYPKHIMWEDFDVDGRHRQGFYNLRVDKRPVLDPMSRTTYTMDITGNNVNITAKTVTYEVLETDPYWHSIEMKIKRHYSEATDLQFTVFLDEHLVDINRKVTVMVNGRKVFAGKLKPNLQNMAESLATFGDPCRIYTAAVQVKL